MNDKAIIFENYFYRMFSIKNIFPYDKTRNDYYS